MIGGVNPGSESLIPLACWINCFQLTVDINFVGLFNGL